MPERRRSLKVLQLAIALTLGAMFSSCIPANLVNGDYYMPTSTPHALDIDTLLDENYQTTPFKLDAALRRCKGKVDNPYVGVCEVCPPKGGKCLDGIITRRTIINLTSPTITSPLPIKRLSLDAHTICLKRGVYTLGARSLTDKGYDNKTVIIDKISCRH